jgi:hypothetical protein
MLAYSRTKSVGVQKQGEDKRVVSGVLEDELYAMQCEMMVDWPSLTIETVQTNMKRFTTTRCLRAENIFVNAEGWKIGPELDSRIKKELGRQGCRHMAILMVDCLRAVARAELARDLTEALQKEPELDRGKFAEDFLAKYPDLLGYIKLS